MTEEKNDVSTVKDPEKRRAAYNRAVREARLLTLVLSELNYKVNRQNQPEEPSEAKFSYAGRVSEFSLSVENNAIFTQIEWTVEIKVKSKRFAKCVARYDLIYDNFSTVDEDIAMVFAQSVAQPASYAYFRSLFATLDWSAEIRSPPLPVIKFYPRI
jgi:hypothetical protein